MAGTRPDVTPARLWDPSRRALVTGLVGSVTFVAVEALAVATVLPLLAHSLHGVALYGWVVSAFMLSSLVGIVVAGRMADRRGPAPPYALGVGCFAAGLVVAGLAPTMLVLIAGRILQGLGAGVVSTVAYVAIGRALPEDLRARMFAVLSTAWVVPGVVGPALAAQVGRLFGWRWVFLGLVPIVLGAGALALVGLRRLGPPSAVASNEHRVVDGLQAALGAALALAGLGSGRPLVAGGLLLAAPFVAIPPLRRLLPMGTLRAAPGLPTTVLLRGLLTFAFFGGDAFVTLALVGGRHWTIAWASAAVTGAALSWTAGAWFQAHRHGQWSPQRFVRYGLLLVVVGTAGMLIVLRPGTPVALGVLTWTVAGAGMGLAYAPLSLLTLSGAPPAGEGWATTSLSLCDVLGTALGAGVGGAAVALGDRFGWPLSDGLTLAFILSGAVAIGAFVLTARLPHSPATSAEA